MTGHEVAGVVAPQLEGADAANLDTPPTQELPVQLAPPSPAVSQATQRRYRALAAAVRHHEVASSHPAIPKRPADHALYDTLDKLESIPPILGRGARA